VVTNVVDVVERFMTMVV